MCCFSSYFLLAFSAAEISLGLGESAPIALQVCASSASGLFFASSCNKERQFMKWNVGSRLRVTGVQRDRGGARRGRRASNHAADAPLSARLAAVGSAWHFTRLPHDVISQWKGQFVPLNLRHAWTCGVLSRLLPLNRRYVSGICFLFYSRCFVKVYFSSDTNLIRV